MLDNINELELVNIYTYNGQLIYSNNNYVDGKAIKLSSKGPFLFKLFMKDGKEYALFR